MRVLKRLSFVALLALACPLACSARGSSDTPTTTNEPIKECEAFLGSLGHCLKSLGPADIASAQVAQARAAIETQLSRASRASVRDQCATNLKQMTCR